MKHLIYIIIVLLITGCNKDIEMNEFHKMYGSDTNDVGALIQEVAKHKIYFGHQSVGNNILSGINQWEEETGVKLEKTNTRDFSDMVSASFVHYYVGENGDAYSKINDFVSQVEKIPVDSISTAFFKLCYVDMHTYSDVEAIFEYYKEKNNSRRFDMLRHAKRLNSDYVRDNDHMLSEKEKSL